MTIPFWPLFGGTLIGLSAVLLMLFIGRIAGISGIIWGAISKPSTDRSWRIAFLIGILLGAFLFHQLSEIDYPTINPNFALAGVAGLLVGIGVKLGNGCTSGHGVCGIGRFSLRSLIATTTFMVVAIIIVAITNQIS